MMPHVEIYTHQSGVCWFSEEGRFVPPTQMLSHAESFVNKKPPTVFGWAVNGIINDFNMFGKIKAVGRGH